MEMPKSGRKRLCAGEPEVLTSVPTRHSVNTIVNTRSAHGTVGINPSQLTSDRNSAEENPISKMLLLNRWRQLGSSNHDHSLWTRIKHRLKPLQGTHTTQGKLIFY